MINQHNLQNVLIYYDSTSLKTTVEDNLLSTEANIVVSIPELSTIYDLDISPLKDIFIPLSILQNNSSLEAIVLYLKETLHLTYSVIALILNRNPRTIWATYANAKKKKVTLNLDNISDIMLPLSVFVSRNFSTLETIVFYLRMDQVLSFNQISLLLGKNYRTVWTIYKRALKKLGKKTIGKNNT